MIGASRTVRQRLGSAQPPDESERGGDEPPTGEDCDQEDDNSRSDHRNSRTSGKPTAAERQPAGREQDEGGDAEESRGEQGERGDRALDAIPPQLLIPVDRRQCLAARQRVEHRDADHSQRQKCAKRDAHNAET